MADQELDRIFATFTVDADVLIEATPDDVWCLITDVARMAEFSPECVRIEWLEGPPAPEVGARFAGTNRWTLDRLPPARRAGLPADWTFEWTLPCEIVVSERPRRFAYVVGDRFDGSPSTEWSFEIETVDGGRTRLTERMRHLPSGRSFNRTEADKHPDAARQIVADRTRVLRSDLQRTITAVRQALEERPG